MEHADWIVGPYNAGPSTTIQCSPNSIPVSADEQFVRHVGYSYGNSRIANFFSPESIRLISRKITQLLEGLRSDGRPILVPDETIAHAMSSIWESYVPKTGDIYSRYTIPGSGTDDMIRDLTDRTIQLITNTIKTEYQMKECNDKLTRWTTLYGNFNAHNLTQTPPIKVRRRRPQRMFFFENY